MQAIRYYVYKMHAVYRLATGYC